MVAYARENFPEGSWRRQIKPEAGDMNTTVIKPAVGRTIIWPSLWMDLRWVYCLQNGLPLDMNVYDLATWSVICEIS